jgi:hypothetical protein
MIESKEIFNCFNSSKLCYWGAVMIFRKKMINAIVMAIIALQPIFVQTSEPGHISPGHPDWETIVGIRINQWLKQWGCEDALSDKANRKADSLNQLFFASQGALEVIRNTVAELQPLLFDHLPTEPERAILTRLYRGAVGIVRRDIAENTFYHSVLSNLLSLETEQRLLNSTWKDLQVVDTNKELSKIEFWLCRVIGMCSGSGSSEELPERITKLLYDWEQCDSALAGYFFRHYLKDVKGVIQRKRNKDITGIIGVPNNNEQKALTADIIGVPMHEEL